MTDYELLSLLKLSIPINTDAFDVLLAHQIDTAKERIAREGIALGDTCEDNDLIVMYAAYLYRKRTLSGDESKMPRMLRYALNNRLFSQKGRV